MSDSDRSDEPTESTTNDPTASRPDAPAGTEPHDVADARPDAPDVDPERIESLAREMEERGWTGSPLVVHGDQVVGGLERYEAARSLGIQAEVPRIPLDEVFREAGMDVPQIASETGGTTPERELFHDYLRDLPRHIREKYEL